MHAFARFPLWCGRDVAVSMTPEHVKPVTFLREIDSVTLTQIRSCTSHGKAHSGVGASRKGTLCVTARMQNTPFGEVRDQSAVFREASGGPGRRVRFSVRRRHVCAGEEKCILRKSAVCVRGATEKRILRACPHGKAQSVWLPACRMRFCVRRRVQNAPLREASGAEYAFA